MTISHNQIFSNATPYDGGGIYTHQSAVALNTNMVFSNTARAGGELFLDYSPATIIGNHITSNTTTFEDHHDGGGLYLNSSPVTFANNTIAANQASGLGGGLTLYYSDATFDSDIISSNTSGSSGGGVMAWLSRVLLTKAKVISNTATGPGGGLQLYYATGTLINTVIVNNQTADTASGMNLAASEAHLMHTTIAHNHGGDGSALRVDLGCYRWCSPSHFEAIDTVIVSHTIGITVGRQTVWGINSALLDHVLWFGNGMDTAGEGVITVTQPVIGDPSFAADGYHLLFGSAAIDRGIDTGVYTDIDDEPRFMGIGYDLGADEFATGRLVAQQATPSVVQTGGQVTYTISVTNIRTVDLITIITDTLPEHIVFVQTPGGPSITPGSIITWAPMISASGGVWPQTMIITAEIGYVGPLTNLIMATAEGNAIGGSVSTVMVVKPQLFMSLIMRR